MQHPRPRTALGPLAAVLAPLLAAAAIPVGDVILPLGFEVEWVPAGLLSPEATVEIAADGRITGGGEVRHDPVSDGERDEPFGRVHAWLAEVAQGMSKAPVEGGDTVADEPLLIRADRDVPFHYVLKVMEQCSRPEVSIPKVLFLVDTPMEVEPPGDVDGEVISVIDASIPATPAVLVDGQPVEKLELRVSVEREGKQVRADDPGVEWDGSEDTPWRYDPHTRVIEYRLGPLKTRSLDQLEERLRGFRANEVQVSIRTHPGTLLEDVVPVMEAARRAGYEDLSFNASSE